MTLYREATATIKLIVFFSLTTFLQQVNAQQTGRMDTDRPDQTESVSITKKDYLQAEIGFNKEKYGTGFTWVHPTALWKLGLNSRFELRLITEANTLKSGPTKISGLVPTQIGGKIALWKEKGIIPQTSLIFHTGIPALGSTTFKTPFLSPNFRFTLQHTFTDRIARVIILVQNGTAMVVHLIGYIRLPQESIWANAGMLMQKFLAVYDP